jgi:hypothetical protein
MAVPITVSRHVSSFTAILPTAILPMAATDISAGQSAAADLSILPTAAANISARRPTARLAAAPADLFAGRRTTAAVYGRRI